MRNDSLSASSALDGSHGGTTDFKEDITSFLSAWSDGDTDALEGLIPKVYEQLGSMAARYLRGERPDHTLSTSALVHESYLRMVEMESVCFTSRGQFYAASARIMRNILVDHARQAGRVKRGGEVRKVPIEEVAVAESERLPRLVALDDALRRLASTDPEQALVVELRYFAGLNRDEIADVLGISSATVTRRWLTARARLYRCLVQGLEDDL